MRDHPTLVLCGATALFLAAMSGGALVGQNQLVDINPSSSTLASSDADGASGGRVNGLARADATTFYAASEWGGLYKSSDTGNTWSRLDAHLAVCPGCASVLEQFRAIIAMTGRLAEHDVDALTDAQRDPLVAVFRAWAVNRS